MSKQTKKRPRDKRDKPIKFLVNERERVFIEGEAAKSGWTLSAHVRWVILNLLMPETVYIKFDPNKKQ